MDIGQFVFHSTGSLCNADAAVKALAAGLFPIIPGKRVAGRARTARIAPGQNAAIHRAVHEAQPGDMLVVDGGGSDRFGAFGDLLAEGCLARGVTGAVLDCSIRDSAEIRALGFQVFARGRHPESTAKTEPGETGITIVCAGVRVRPGDILVGDDDGIVVVPRESAARVLEAVAETERREEAIRARIRGGESTLEIFGLDRS